VSSWPSGAAAFRCSTSLKLALGGRVEPAMPDPGLEQLIDHLDNVFLTLVTAAAGDQVKAATVLGTYALRATINLVLEEADPEAVALLKVWAAYISDGIAGRDPAPDPSLALH
jgi:hypothetical protein